MDPWLFFCGPHRLDLRSTQVMAIVNLTPDSFSDGGAHGTTASVVDAVHQAIEAGAAIVDLGAESSRPGATVVSEAEELARLVPVLKALRDLSVPLSVDTYKPAVMRAALDLGVSMINDIWALRQPGALAAVRSSQCGVCLMHMQGEPATMQDAPHYGDVVAEVRQFLNERVAHLDGIGVGLHRIVVDPGFGFGKTAEHNLALMRALDQLATPGVNVLVGLSRKGWLGRVTGKPVDERLGAGIAAALAAVSRGARIVRTHDVAATVDALKIWEMVENPAPGAVDAHQGATLGQP